MFRDKSYERKPSLLMRADGAPENGAVKNPSENVIPLSNNNDTATAHRLARASRRSAKPNPLLSALGRKTTADEIQGGTFPNSYSNEEAAIRSQPTRQDNQPNYQDLLYAGDDAFKPLIDPVIMLDALWRWRWPIAGLTMLGGAVGVMAAINAPSYYTAYSKVLIDPRQVKLVERDLTPEFLGNEAALAIVDSQLETVVSTPVLERVIERLNLDQNADFNGEADSGIGLFDGIAFVRSLFNSEIPVETTERTTLENLRSAVSAQRAARTFVFDISAKAKSPRLSAEIANAVTRSFIEIQSKRQTDAARNATSALGGQITVLKQAVEQAEERAERFAQDNDLMRVEGLTLSDTQLVATSAQLTEAKAATIRAKSVAAAAKDASVDQVVNGGLPPLLVTPGLTTFRAQFASLSQNAASLEQALGPRHPRLANAIAARDAARNEIAAELTRIKAGTQADLRAAIENEQEIATALTRVKVQSGDSGDALIKLRELEAEIETARTLYKAALLRAGETTQLEEVTNVNTSIVAEAEAPCVASFTFANKLIALCGRSFPDYSQVLVWHSYRDYATIFQLTAVAHLKHQGQVAQTRHDKLRDAHQTALT
ncbi:MAG: GumC family protein [Ahrensia sp.]|nr:GumC family protein [Ahrensia sp.]